MFLPQNKTANFNQGDLITKCNCEEVSFGIISILNSLKAKIYCVFPNVPNIALHWFKYTFIEVKRTAPDKLYSPEY